MPAVSQAERVEPSKTNQSYLGALQLGKLQRLVVDASHIDQKKRGVMDMKDTMMPLARFLTSTDFKDRYVDEKKPLALLFY